MMNKLLLPVLLISSLFFAQCNSSGQQDPETSNGDDMAQFSEDQNFRDAHEKPDSLDFQGKGSMMEFSTPDGSTGKAYTIKAAEPTNEYLLVIHEWWGLNDHIKREAERLFDKLNNVTVMALDLYDGKVTDDPDQAGKFMQAIEQDRCEAIINGALAVAGKDGKVATIGWCFGGGWSLRSSILAGDRGIGCVMYYGMPVEKAGELAPIESDILGIFAEKDDWINKDVVSKFESLAKATDTELEVHWFDAQHAFANPSSPRYNEDAANKANALSLAYLQNKFENN